MSIATEPRNLLAIYLRKFIYLLYRKAKFLYKIFAANKPKEIKKILFYPTINNIGVLSDLLNRIGWYLPNLDGSVKIEIPVVKELLEINHNDLSAPLSQKKYIELAKNISLIKSNEINKSNKDLILIWDKFSLYDSFVIKNLSLIEIVDPTFFSTVESVVYQNLFYMTLSQKEKDNYYLLSNSNFNKMLINTNKYKKSYVFCTGPSLEEAFRYNYEDGFCIICNSIIKNKKLMNHIKPHLLVFADPVFHFSPCLYSAEFRRLVIDAVSKYNCYIIIPERSLPLFLKHYPQLKENIIGMPERIENYNFPTTKNFYVKSTSNILTLYMLPVASSVTENIYIIGADGRKKNDNYFWKHSSSAQFNELMQTVFDTHPSFFRDRIYTDYYKEHCTILNELIIYGENNGKKYYSLTSSHIPALAKRFIGEV